MRDQKDANAGRVESAICESDLGFEIIDMLAQANIDFRRLPAEELRNLLASAQPERGFFRRRTLAAAMA